MATELMDLRKQNRLLEDQIKGYQGQLIQNSYSTGVNDRTFNEPSNSQYSKNLENHNSLPVPTIPFSQTNIEKNGFSQKIPSKEEALKSLNELLENRLQNRLKS